MKSYRKYQIPRNISICVSKISNWPQSYRGTYSMFQLSFYAKSNRSLILCKTTNGKYLGNSYEMLLNTIFRVNYTGEENKVKFIFIIEVILRLYHKRGLSGVVVLGEFYVDLLELTKYKGLKFLIDAKQCQYLIVQQHCEDKRSNNFIKGPSQQAINELLLYEYKYGINYQRKSSSKTKYFIKQREEFLETRSQKSKNNSMGGVRGVGGGEKGDYCYDSFSGGNCWYEKDNNTNRLLSTQSSYASHENRGKNQYFISPYRHKKNIGTNHHQSITTSNHHKGASSNKSSRKSSSSQQRYLLMVSNLNVVPIDEYYSTATTRGKKIIIKYGEERRKKASYYLKYSSTTGTKSKGMIKIEYYATNSINKYHKQLDTKTKFYIKYQLFKRYSYYYS